MYHVWKLWRIQLEIKLMQWTSGCSVVQIPQIKRSPFSHATYKYATVHVCESACVRLCICECVGVGVCVHASTLLYRSITWASDCAISPVSPLCSPRRLILPGGMVLMWEAEKGGGRVRRGRVTTHIICLRAAQTAWPQPPSPYCWLQHLAFGPSNLKCFVHWNQAMAHLGTVAVTALFPIYHRYQ